MENIYKISKYHLERRPDSAEEYEEWNNASNLQDLEEEHIQETAKEMKETADLTKCSLDLSQGEKLTQFTC